MRKVLIASVIGTVIEWLDFFLYVAVAALVFDTAFFPTSDPAVGSILAFASIAVGFCARPIGGIVFGHLGDRIGRKRVLTLTMTLMGLATITIGLLPTYASIGIWAPILLVTLRIVQGLGVGGEYGGAVLMILEHGRNFRRRGLLGALPNACASAGFLLATGFLAVMAGLTTEAQFQSWGWRVPFLACAAVVVVGYYIRLKVDESPVFEAAEKRDTVKRFPLAALLRDQPLACLVAFAATVSVAMAYNMVLVYAPGFITGTGVTSGTMLTVNTIAQMLYIPLVIGWGAASDIIGRRVAMTIGMVGVAVWMFAFFPLVDDGSNATIVVAIVVALFFIAAMYGPQAVFLTSLFRPEYRYSGVSLGYQMAFAIAGGLTPILSVAWYENYESTLPMSLWVLLGCAVSLGALLLSRRNPTTEDQTPSPAGSPVRKQSAT